MCVPVISTVLSFLDQAGFTDSFIWNKSRSTRRAREGPLESTVLWITAAPTPANNSNSRRSAYSREHVLHRYIRDNKWLQPEVPIRSHTHPLSGVTREAVSSVVMLTHQPEPTTCWKVRVHNHFKLSTRLCQCSCTLTTQSMILERLLWLKNMKMKTTKTEK